MNTSGGGDLYFNADLNNEKLIGAIDEAERRVKGFSKTTVAEGEKIEQAFEITAENIRIQKDVIGQIEKQINNLNIEISKLKPGKAQDQLKQEAKQLTAELKAEKDALKMLENAFQATETKAKTTRTQIRELKEELIRMEAAGLRGTPAYDKVQKKLGELTDAMGDAAAQARVLANDERGFQGVVSMVGGLTGAMSAAQGAVGLFAGENENLNKIMLKVQSMMAITIGLQQVAEMLNKDSYFNIVILTKAKEMFAVAELKVATAMGISTAAARVLMATLTLGLSVAITAIIVAISKLQSKQSEAKKAQEAFNKSVADSAGEPVAAIMQLSAQWKSLGNDMQAKKKFIDENAGKFEDLGIAINDVNEAEKLLTDDATLRKFVSAMIARAKSMAAVEVASAKYKEALLKEQQLDATPKTVTRAYNTGMYSGGVTYQAANPKYTKLEEEKKKLQKEADDMIQKSVTFSAEEKKLLDQIGIHGKKVVDGSIIALEENISNLNKKYKEAASDKERKSILQQIIDEQAKLDRMDQTDEIGKTKSKDPFKDSLEKKKAAYQQYFKWLNSNDPILQKAAKTEFASILKEGNSFMEYLKKQRENLMGMGTKTDAQKSQLTTINNLISEETKSTVLKDFETALNTQLGKAETALEMLKLIREEKEKLSGDNSELDAAKKELLDQAEQTANEKAAEEQKQRKTEYEQLVAEYADFERRKQAIIDQFDKKRKTAGTDQGVIDGLNRAQAEAVKALQEEFIKAAGLQDLFTGKGADFLTEKIKVAMPLFSELADATKTELEQVKKVIQGIEVTPDQKALLVSIGLTEKQVEELIAKLEKLKKEGAAAVDEQKWKKTLDSIGKIASSVGELGNVLEGYGGIIGEIGEGLSGLAGSFDDIYTAMTSKDQMQVASAGISGVANLLGMVLNQIEANKRAQEEWNAKIVESAHNMKMAKLEAMDYHDSNIFGVNNPYAEAISGMNQYAEAMKMLNDSAGELGGGQVQVGTKKVVDGGNVLKGAGYGAAAGAAVGSIIPGLGTAIGAGIGAIIGGITGAVSKKTVPVFESLKKKYGEIYNKDTFELNPKILADYSKLDDATKQMVDNWKEIKEKAIEAQKQIEETLKGIAGDLGTSLSDSLRDAFSNGDLYAAVDDFHAKVTQTIDDIISQLIFNQVFGKMFDDLSANMKASFGDGGDQSIVDDIVKFNETYKGGLDAYNKAMTDAQALLKQQGFNIGAGVENKALSGAIQGITSEEASVLSGQTNAIRINQIEGLSIMRNQLLAMNRIAENTAYNVNLTKLGEVVSLLQKMANGDTRSLGLG